MFYITQKIVKHPNKIKYATQYFESMNNYLLQMDKFHKENRLKQISSQEPINFLILSQSNFKTLCPPSTNKSSA